MVSLILLHYKLFVMGLTITPGGYISFPDFDQFGDYDDESLKRLQSLRIQ